MSDEDLMDIARPYAADGGRWPSDWLAVMRIAFNKGQELMRDKCISRLGDYNATACAQICAGIPLQEEV